LIKKILNNLLRFRGGISIIFYIALFALLWYLIIPHTSFYYRDNFFSPFWQRLNREDVTLIEGEEFKLYVMGINKKLSFRSTDIKVADVDLFGNVTAYRCGTTIIKAKVEGKILKCRVKVININKKNLNLKVGKRKRLKIRGVWYGVHWSSSNTSVVIVNRYGKVTAIAKGKAVIYGKVRGKTMKCKISVN
jgi:uncharacterized protein YjdB